MADSYEKPKPPIVPLYAATIHNCIAGGDLARMKALATEAEPYGDVSAALTLLKAEIAKAEGGR